MRETREPFIIAYGAHVLAALSANMEVTVSAEAATIIAQAMKRNREPRILSQLAQGLTAIAARLEAKEAATLIADAATSLVETMTDRESGGAISIQAPYLLSALLSGEPPLDIRNRAFTTVSALAILAGPRHSLTALSMLGVAAKPMTCRLSTQQLVELLKMPTCVVETRRIILAQLAIRYHRPFGDVWEFVRFAEVNLPDIDLTSPPQRPEPVVREY